MKIDDALDYLRRQQAPDGSFTGWASATLKPFNPTRPQPTIFPTMLILDCLHDVVGAEDIRLRAAKYLEAQVGEQGSWNYWDRTSKAARQEPYPDDLDDTAYALAALTRADAKWVDGSRLGQLARLLIATEQQPGGPYNTWLIDTSRASQWRHVDVAVNANIGYALSLQSVRTSGLCHYIDKAIQGGQLQSDYYVGSAPVIYFISRWYDGDQLAALQEQVVRLARKPRLSALHTALLLSAGCRLRVDDNCLKPLAEQLRNRTNWPAAALYVDPVYDKHQHYGGSVALTTAFVLEALALHDARAADRPPIISRKHGVPRLMGHIQKDAKRIPDLALRRRYLALARQLMQDIAGEQITDPATLVAQAGGWEVADATLMSLNAGALNGWMAYTLYDDILDGDANADQLPIAGVALRRSYEHFAHALPDQRTWLEQVTETFDLIDGANYWEQQHARADTRGGVFELRRLPDYGDYSQLAHRSLGHRLAGTGVALVHYGSLEHPQVRALQTFFKHFLIARQLNDDAHDWEEDLQSGRLTAVVTMLLGAVYEPPHHFVIDDELDGLRQYFWQHTIGDVVALTRHHLQAAQTALATLRSDMNTTSFASWIDALELAGNAALHGRQEALQFMQAYEGYHA